jgi:catechol 2,3-dioxygenase-like lactoylglutathione lyase family enzyme
MDSIAVRWAVVAAVVIGPTVPSTARAEQAGDRAVFQSFHPSLWVTDIRRSVEFYKTVLEFQLDGYTVGNAREVKELSPTDPVPYGADLRVGEHRFALQAGWQKGATPAGVRLIVRVGDPAAYATRIQTRGVSVTVIATSKGQPFWFRVSDPDGHDWEFIGPMGGAATR